MTEQIQILQFHTACISRDLKVLWIALKSVLNAFRRKPSLDAPDLAHATELNHGFTVCAVKNNLGTPVVLFMLKRTRFELLFLCCGDHFRKQMYSICMCFQDYYYAGYVVCFVSVYTISCCIVYQHDMENNRKQYKQRQNNN